MFVVKVYLCEIKNVVIWWCWVKMAKLMNLKHLKLNHLQIMKNNEEDDTTLNNFYWNDQLCRQMPTILLSFITWKTNKVCHKKKKTVYNEINHDQIVFIVIFLLVYRLNSRLNCCSESDGSSISVLVLPVQNKTQQCCSNVLLTTSAEERIWKLGS